MVGYLMANGLNITHTYSCKKMEP